MGHGVLFKEECTSEIAQAFLKNPRQPVVTDCLADIAAYPDFNLNTAPPTPEPFIEMKSYESRTERKTR